MCRASTAHDSSLAKHAAAMSRRSWHARPFLDHFFDRRLISARDVDRGSHRISSTCMCKGRRRRHCVLQVLHDSAFKSRKKKRTRGGVIAYRSPAQRVIVRMAPRQTLRRARQLAPTSSSLPPPRRQAAAPTAPSPPGDSATGGYLKSAELPCYDSIEGAGWSASALQDASSPAR